MIRGLDISDCDPLLAWQGDPAASQWEVDGNTDQILGGIVKIETNYKGQGRMERKHK